MSDIKIPEPADWVKTEDGVEPLYTPENFEAFAALVRADERQKCAEAVRAWSRGFDDDEPTKRWLKIAADRLENPGMRP